MKNAIAFLHQCLVKLLVILLSADFGYEEATLNSGSILQGKGTR